MRFSLETMHRACLRYVDWRNEHLRFPTSLRTLISSKGGCFDIWVLLFWVTSVNLLPKQRTTAEAPAGKLGFSLCASHQGPCDGLSKHELLKSAWWLPALPTRVGSEVLVCGTWRDQNVAAASRNCCCLWILSWVWLKWLALKVALTSKTMASLALKRDEPLEIWADHPFVDTPDTAVTKPPFLWVPQRMVPWCRAGRLDTQGACVSGWESSQMTKKTQI